MNQEGAKEAEITDAEYERAFGMPRLSERDRRSAKPEPRTVMGRLLDWLDDAIKDASVRTNEDFYRGYLHAMRQVKGQIGVLEYQDAIREREEDKAQEELRAKNIRRIHQERTSKKA